MAIKFIGNFSVEEILKVSKELEKQGYISREFGVPSGSYSGIVDDRADFVSFRTYRNTEGRNDDLFAVLATITNSAGTTYKVVGFEQPDKRHFLVSREQSRLLTKGCKFAFQMSESGFCKNLRIV